MAKNIVTLSKSIFAASLTAAAVGYGSAAETDSRGENLIKNSEFREKMAKPWGAPAGVVFKETEKFSNVYMMSAVGPNYHFGGYVDDPDLKWEAGEQFTIAIDCRSVGSGASMLIIHRYTKADGNLGEGWAKRLQPTSDWHEYIIPFTATKGGKPRGFSFFKIDNGAHDTGIQIRSFKMYRGRISALDFIPVGRNARASVRKEDALPLPANPYGPAAKALKALVVVKDLQSLREGKSVFAGTGAKVHVISAEAKDTATFTTDDDPKEIRAMLKAGGYDLYAFGRSSAMNVGEELFQLIDANVKKGAAVYFAPNPEKDYGRFAALHEAAKTGKYGEGRVSADEVVKGVDDEWPTRHRPFLTDGPLTGEYAYSPIRYEEIGLALCADRLMKAAFGEPEMKDAKTERKTAIYRGLVHTLEYTKDAAGKTLAFGYSTEPVEGASLGEMNDTGKAVEIAISNCTMTAELRWKFRDFSGRLFGEGTAKGPVASLAVPREKLYTDYGLLQTELYDGGRLVDRRNYMVIEPENDRTRMIRDYGIGFWGTKAGYDHCDARAMMKTLGKYGFRYAFCHSGLADMYATGMAATGFYVIGGEYFSGGPTSKNNVRSPVFNTPEARKRIREKALSWAKKNKKTGGMYGSFSDEARLTPNGEEVDAHPENLKVYRRWMEKKYGTITEYNRRHLTDHASFAELGQTLLADARKAKNAAEFVEWRDFNVERWIEVIREVGDAIKEVDPKVLYSLDNCFGERALDGSDFWRLLSKTGLDYSKEYVCTTSFGEDPFNEFDFLYRSWRPDMRLWGWTGYGFTEERTRALPWMTALHRQGGFHYFAATYYGINLLDLVTGAPTLDCRETAKAVEESRMTKGLGKTLTDWEWAKNDCAIYYSHASCLVSYFLGTETKRDDCFAGTPYHGFQYSRSNAYFMLCNLFYQPEWVSQEQAEGGYLDGGDWSVYGAGKVITGQPAFKLLIMPHILAMTDREVAAVKAFLKRGGKVVCDVLPGEYDELGVKRAAMPFTAEEMTVFGGEFNSHDDAQRKRMLALLKTAGVTPAIESPTAFDNPDREAVHYREGEADLYAVIRKPKHANVGKKHDENLDELRFRKAGHVYDVRAGKYLGVTDRVSAKTPYAEACLYAVLPAKIDGIAINQTIKQSNNQTISRGTDLAVSLELKTSNLQTFKHSNIQTIPRYVLHAELVPPSGKCEFHFQRNLETKDGRASFAFPLALNDETGEWKVRVTEPLTGVSAEKTFTVK